MKELSDSEIKQLSKSASELYNENVKLKSQLKERDEIIFAIKYGISELTSKTK